MIKTVVVFLVLIAVVLLTRTGLSQNQLPYPVEIAPPALPVDTVGRLVVVPPGGVCTAFAVRSQYKRVRTSYRGGETDAWETLVATAGHCVVVGGHDIVTNKIAYMYYHSPYDVVTAWLDKPFGIPASYRAFYAEVVGFTLSRGLDAALLRVYSQYPVPTLRPKWGYVPRRGEKMVSVSYPAGSFVARVGEVIEIDERGFIGVYNTVSSGSSGSPMILQGTREVVGIIVESSCAKSEPKMPNPGDGENPFGLCKRVAPYWAVPIDQLWNLYRW